MTILHSGTSEKYGDNFSRAFGVPASTTKSGTEGSAKADTKASKATKTSKSAKTTKAEKSTKPAKAAKGKRS